MDVRYSNQPPFEGGGRSVFLAGPTPRDKDTPSWRPEALKMLQHWGYDGAVMVPERSDSNAKINYDDQVEWEYQGLCRCSNILFWVPREISKMPAFTTNVEFGYWMGVTSESGVSKVFYGRPDDAPKNRYLDWMYEKTTGRKPYSTLPQLLFAVAKHQGGLDEFTRKYDPT